jgi:Fe-S cluster biogenesis protein NfuA
VLAPGPSAEELVERVGRLTAELERIDDPSARQAAEELIGSVVELYGQGLERIVALVSESSDEELPRLLPEDGVIASLLLIHGLYPVPLSERVTEALDGVRPYMESHGGDVELLGISDGVARIRLEGSCEGCPASASTLELAIKSALDEAAPDLEGLVVEGAVATPATSGPDALELPVVQVGANGSPHTEGPAWVDVDGLEAIADGDLLVIAVQGTPIVVARVEGSLLAFHDRCAGCGSSLATATLADGTLTCSACGRAYFLPRAGRSLDDDRLLLAPVPLLAGSRGARVALGA